MPNANPGGNPAGLMIVIAKDSSISHHCPFFCECLCGKAASGLEEILCKVLVKRTRG